MRIATTLLVLAAALSTFLVAACGGPKPPMQPDNDQSTLEEGAGSAAPAPSAAPATSAH
ncbi:MAG TPA: hypothetical protein VGG39_18555 [Polyangiaceae bacterium]|jgi:hypothetical protein